ncbi:MAG TPA: MFS transporter [Chloroflexota bacterium]|nr:MFS transporter [Chloroflexota bacterium]
MTARSDALRAGVERLSQPAGILILVSTAHAITHVYAALFPLVYPSIQQEWGLSYTAIGTMVGLTSFIGGSLQLLFGFIGRSFPRNVVLGLGNLLFGITTALTGVSANFTQFAALRFGGAVANAAQHPVGNSLIADRFPRERRGSALAVNFAGGNLGTLAVPLIAVALIGTLGWRQALWAFAVPGIVMGGILMFAMDDRDRARDRIQGHGSGIAQLGRILRNRNVLALVGASSVAAAGRGLGVLLTIIPLYLSNVLGLAPWIVGMLYTIMLVGSVVGPMAAGRLSDRVGRKLVLVGALVLATIVTLALPAFHEGGVAVLAVVLFLMGAFAFAESPLVQTFAADSVAAGERDILFGFYYAWVFAVGAGWIALIAALIDRVGFEPVWGLIAASYLASALLILLARETRRGAAQTA